MFLTFGSVRSGICLRMLSAVTWILMNLTKIKMSVYIMRLSSGVEGFGEVQENC